MNVYSIQYLRGLAALAVLVFHTSETYDLGFHVGAAGVDIFFVISGFIMWITTANQKITPGQFLYRRAVRIVPLYWIVTLLTALGIALKPAFFFDHDASLSNLVGSLLFLPNAKDNAMHPVVIQGWTLSYEMFFYAVFAAALLLQFKYRLFVIIACLLTLSLSHYFTQSGYPYIYTNPLLLEFAGGMLIGAAWLNNKALTLPFSIGSIVAGLIIFAASNTRLSELERLIQWGLPSILIVAGAVSLEKRTALQKIKSLNFFGDASYSIYLWHVLFGIVITGILLRLKTPEMLMPYAVIGLSFIGTLIAYLLVEKPINKWLKARREKTRQHAGQ